MFFSLLEPETSTEPTTNLALIVGGWMTYMALAGKRP
jgi:hypothetical protein